MIGFSIKFQNVTFAYEGTSRALIRDLSVHLARGWTGVVGANGVGKTTILKLATGHLMPQSGCVTIPEFAIYCQQRTDDIPDKLGDLTHSLGGEACQIRGQLGIEDDWIKRWSTLSHGERKRAQIAAAVWQRPQVLAVDEPTNHLDFYAQELLYEVLSRYQGIGLLVSHDRKLLDNLCYQCLFIDPPDTVLRPGNYTLALRQSELEQVVVRKQHALARQELSRLSREAGKRRSGASHAHRKRSKRGLAPKDHDSRGKIDLARLTGKDATDGKKLRQIESRISRLRSKMDLIRIKKTYDMGIWMPGSQSRRKTLFDIPGGHLFLGEGRYLDFPDLSMKHDDRIALTGPNGSGKSTLISHIMRSPGIREDHVTYLPQEIDIHASKGIMARARELPNEKLGLMMTVVSRLGSRPHRLLESEEPSPGEVRKILLATGIANVPFLIVMDEPTNHLDLPSIECLEKALADCPCGLLLVSHDSRFLSALARKRWHITDDNAIKGKYTLSKSESFP
jgi:ATPase subunit of ABC transporter with duplicated ATPase domains